jgi:hypothetical protein
VAQHLSREQFRRWAEGQERRYERIAGEPVAMSPERIEHARVRSGSWAGLERAVRQADLADYFKLASIQHCLMARVRRREVIHHSRSGAEIVSRVIDLDPPGIGIGLADIYPPAG